MAAREELIKLYFNHLDNKLEKIREISKISEEESLMLCCCYTEALGVRQYQAIDYIDPPRKAIPYFSKSAAFTEILAQLSGYDFWDKIHPLGLLDYMPKMFNNAYQEYMIALNEIGYELREKEFIIEHVYKLFENKNQKDWFETHIHKGTIGNLTYSKVRSEIVHNITHEPIKYLATWKGCQLPEINYELMENCLSNIIVNLKSVSLEKNTFWWEQ